MSRVTYANVSATAAQETLRRTHDVRIVTVEEEGSGVNALPNGVYGFTYSPGLLNAPLFATRRYRSYETHRTANGAVFLVGFTSGPVAEQLAVAPDEVTSVVQPDPDDDASTLVTIPYSRIRHHRQYAAPNQHGFTVTVVGSRR
jgi:hypothetical protein